MIRKTVLNSLYISGTQAVLAPWTRGLGAILCLHHVRDIAPKPFDPNYHLSASPKFLDGMIRKLKARGFQFISMDEVADRLEDPDAFADKPPFLSVTLDDGYRDNVENAVPIFQKHKVPYTLYIAPGLVEGHTMLWWEDLERVIAGRDNIFVDLPGGRSEFDVSTVQKKQNVHKQLVEYLILEVDEALQRQIVSDLSSYYHAEPAKHVKAQILDWSEINQLAGDPLCTLGAHTIGHFALSKLNEEEAVFEMQQSAEILKAETGTRPSHFAYPYGFPDAAALREFELAGKCGFKTAVTTRHGVVYNEHANHMMALPRVAVNGHHQSMHYITTLLSGVPGRLRNFGRKLDVA